MKQISISFSVFILLAFCGCSVFYPPTPEISIKPGFEGKEIAVLDFAVKGLHISNQSGIFAADKLAEKLFLSQKYSVIDRAKVKDGERLLKIASGAVLSFDEIQKIGLRLKAHYLIFGSLTQYDNGDEFTADAESMLQLSFRIVEVNSTEVVGMASYKMKLKDNAAEEVIQNMLSDIVLKMQEDKK